ncbi:MAG: hypothetical protein MZU97_03305 [Bacillus subtilis]|nr:hypothetical protein [Bacillus subtilis]
MLIDAFPTIFEISYTRKDSRTALIPSSRGNRPAARCASGLLSGIRGNPDRSPSSRWST